MISDYRGQTECWSGPCRLLGAVVGWFLPAIADWATGLAGAFSGPLELIATIQGPWIVTAVLGLLAGMVLSTLPLKSLAVRLSDKEITLRIHETERTFAREVSAVFLDGKLVLLGTEGQELYREKPEAKRDAVAEAFKRHGYSWRPRSVR